ncbi:unnamed protein product [Allacma fusca]|uniref:Uncharacterized protein n=1 Tax=Allacma fusca TaxID=39272 RepID=A0A8J2L7M2_9HEXA|nr:unnamed protein product [Allacma fusca]
MRLIMYFGPVTSILLVLKFLFFLLFLPSLVECQQDSGIVWTISKTSSCEDEQQLGCRCETSLLKPKPRTKITCSCEQTSQVQVVNLYGLREQPETYARDVTWRIEDCLDVTVNGKVLPYVTGAHLTLEFVNISSLQLREDAFENSLGSPTTPPLDKSVEFERCNILEIPAKAFPSNLERIEFIDCKIGSILSHSFKQLYMNEMIFKNTEVNDIEPNAFYQDLVNWIAKNSTFKHIQTNAITGGIRHMNWTGCIIENMEENSINALIGHSLFEESHFYRVQSNGLTIKEWTSLSFINNTFHRVNNSAIDLTQRSDAAVTAVIKGNVWLEPEPNFIITGQVDSVIASVENNTFTEVCECGKTFTPMVTIEGSKQWFVKELLRNSRCPISEKATECLERNDTFLYFDELDLLCDAFPCMKGLQPMSEIFPPQLPDRLRILAIFIGTLAGAIVVSLLITMCVYMLRRQPTTKRNETSDITKSFGGPQDFADVVYQISQAPPLRPRSTLFEDVEMEDKGVQTMPNELSTDVLEGLREKLSRPDSFWDAKETIDHLYGLIQVREQSSNNTLSSPPDVTMCNTTGTPTHKYSTTFLPSNHDRKLTSASLSHNPTNNSRYAAIRQKPKTATLCEYRDPSDSQVHIYSELNHQPSQQRQSHLRGLTLPVVCEYNEPKDVQTHVYAELMNLHKPVAVDLQNKGETSQSTTPQKSNISSNNSIRRPLPDIPSISKVQ